MYPFADIIVFEVDEAHYSIQYDVSYRLWIYYGKMENGKYR